MHSAESCDLNPYESPVGVEEYTPPREILRPTPAIQVIAILLAMSGCAFAPIFLENWYVPGCYIWVGWITIAIGFNIFNKVWFWVLSALWDGFWMVAFLPGTAWSIWSFHDRTLDQLHLPLHILASVTLSLTAIVLLLRPTQRPWWIK